MPQRGIESTCKSCGGVMEYDEYGKRINSCQCEYPCPGCGTLFKPAWKRGGGKPDLLETCPACQGTALGEDIKCKRCGFTRPPAFTGGVYCNECMYKLTPEEATGAAPVAPALKAELTHPKQEGGFGIGQLSKKMDDFRQGTGKLAGRKTKTKNVRTRTDLEKRIVDAIFASELLDENASLKLIKQLADVITTALMEE